MCCGRLDVYLQKCCTYRITRVLDVFRLTHDVRIDCLELVCQKQLFMQQQSHDDKETSKRNADERFLVELKKYFARLRKPTNE